MTRSECELFGKAIPRIESSGMAGLKKINIQHLWVFEAHTQKRIKARCQDHRNCRH